MCAPVFNGQHKVGTANGRAHHEKQGVRKADRSDSAPGVIEGFRAERSFYERREGCLLGVLETSRRKEDFFVLVRLTRSWCTWVCRCGCRNLKSRALHSTRREEWSVGVVLFTVSSQHSEGDEKSTVF